MNECLTPESVVRYQAGSGLTSDEIAQIDAHLATCAVCLRLIRSVPAGSAHSLVAELLPDPTDYPCPDEAMLAAFAEDRLDGIDLESVAQHIEHCTRCQADVAAHRLFVREAETADFTSLPKRRWTEWARDRVAAAGVVLRDGAGSALRLWNRAALSARIVGAVVVGSAAGEILGPRMRELEPIGGWVLNLLTAVATPLIFIATVHALLRTDLVGRKTGRLAGLMLTNSIVAAVIGLILGQLIPPDRGALAFEPRLPAAEPLRIPSTLLQPLVENNMLLVILFALGFGTAIRAVRAEQMRAGSSAYRAVEDLFEIAFRCLLLLMRWIIGLVPIAVLVIAADLVGRHGLAGFTPLVRVVAATLTGLTLLAVYYLVRLRFGAGVSPGAFLIASRSALLTAFSTASSAATLPITYAVARDRLRLSEGSASLGVLVGCSINRDGTALFEAIGVLAITHALGIPLSVSHQLLLVIMAIAASICAPGVPEAGLVTMVLIFHALRLPAAANYIVLLLPLDWLLDRCRTSLNVMGHLTVACLLDAREEGIPAAKADGPEVMVLPQPPR